MSKLKGFVAACALVLGGARPRSHFPAPDVRLVALCVPKGRNQIR